MHDHVRVVSTSRVTTVTATATHDRCVGDTEDGVEFGNSGGVDGEAEDVVFSTTATVIVATAVIVASATTSSVVVTAAVVIAVIISRSGCEGLCWALGGW
jgi:hypothetical protein